MSSLRELVFLILQFLDEENFNETMHKLERESGFFFNMRYFEEMVTYGEWDEVEKYLAGFTKVNDNGYSRKIFFEIRKLKYLEALDRKDHAKAVDILVKDLKVFSALNEDLFKEITLLLTLENFRDNERLSNFGDTKSVRAIMLAELKKLIEANPLLRDKLNFPSSNNSRLRTLISQSLNWRHQLPKNLKPNADIKTMNVDHSCEQSQPNGAWVPSPVTNALMNAVPKAGEFPPLGALGPFQPAPAPDSVSTSLAGPAPHSFTSASSIGFTPNNTALLKRPRTPPCMKKTSMEYQTVDSDHVSKRLRPFGISDEVGCQSHGESSYSSDDLPKDVVGTLNQGLPAESADFNPVLDNVGMELGQVTEHDGLVGHNHEEPENLLVQKESLVDKNRDVIISQDRDFSNVRMEIDGFNHSNIVRENEELARDNNINLVNSLGNQNQNSDGITGLTNDQGDQFIVPEFHSKEFEPTRLLEVDKEPCIHEVCEAIDASLNIDMIAGSSKPIENNVKSSPVQRNVSEKAEGELQCKGFDLEKSVSASGVMNSTLCVTADEIEEGEISGDGVYHESMDFIGDSIEENRIKKLQISEEFVGKEEFTGNEQQRGLEKDSDSSPLFVDTFDNVGNDMDGELTENNRNLVEDKSEMLVNGKTIEAKKANEYGCTIETGRIDNQESGANESDSPVSCPENLAPQGEPSAKNGTENQGFASIEKTRKAQIRSSHTYEDQRVRGRVWVRGVPSASQVHQRSDPRLLQQGALQFQQGPLQFQQGSLQFRPQRHPHRLLAPPWLRL